MAGARIGEFLKCVFGCVLFVELHTTARARGGAFLCVLLPMLLGRSAGRGLPLSLSMPRHDALGSRSPAFAVVGASAAREKFGNIVLRCYQAQGLSVIPVNPTALEIEGLPCVAGAVARQQAVLQALVFVCGDAL